MIGAIAYTKVGDVVIMRGFDLQCALIQLI